MKKKSIAMFIITLLTAFLVITQTPIMAKELDHDDYDKVFMETLTKLGSENYSGKLEIAASKELLYDLNLETIGYVYDFVVNGEPGYAIVINSKSIQVNEIYFAANNPYENDSMNIYVSNMQYIEYLPTDNVYRWAGRTELIDDAMLNRLRSAALYSGGNLSTSSTTIHYVTKTENEYAQAKRYPGGCQVGGLSNACVAIAAGNLVQYWDRYHENLIADFIPGTVLGKYYLYKENAEVHASVTKELYDNMHESNYEGITISQFKRGFTAYCNRRGYNVTYNSCISDNRFDYNYAKQKIENGEPLMLFVDAFVASEIYQYDNSDVVNGIVMDGNHAMPAFGYREIIYTLQNHAVQKDTYLAVATGLIDLKRGYCNLENISIDDAYAISVV